MKNKGLSFWFVTLFFCNVLIFPQIGAALTLRCVVDHTLRTNPDIRQTIHILEAANETVMQAQSNFYPSIDLNAAYGRESSLNNNTNFEWVSLWRKELGITLQQMLFDGYATRNDEVRTMADTDAKAFKIYAEAEDTALAAAESYINLLRDKELIVIGEINVKNHRHLAQMITRRAEKGVGRVSDIYQANTRLGLAEAILIQLKSQYNEDSITFQKVTGMCPDDLEAPPDPCNQLPYDQCEAVKLAVGYHPTLKAAVADIEAARAQHRTTFAPVFPRVDLLINSNRSQDLDGNPGANYEDSALLRLQWNLFRGGRDFARQRETAFQVKEFWAIKDRIFRQVVEQMSLAWNALTISAEKFPPLTMHRDDAAKTADAFHKLFMVGRTSLFDLLGTERERFTSGQEFINNKYINLIAKYRMLRSMGQLNKFLCVPLPCQAKACYATLPRAGSFYGPLELDYPCLFGGCCKRKCQD